jgi:ABC-type transport system involved in multi-copper enzyme maturation permease subunit
MKSFWKLYTSELQGLWFYVVGGPLAAAAFILYLATRKGVWRIHEFFNYSFLPLAFLTLFALIFGAWVIEREWNNGTAYQLLALPVSGYTVVGAKLAAVSTIIFLPIAALCIGLISLFWPAGITFLGYPPLYEGMTYYSAPQGYVFAIGPFVSIAFLNGLVGIFIRIAGLWLRPLRVLTGILSLAAWVFTWHIFGYIERLHLETLTIPWPGGFYVRGEEVLLFFTSLPLLPVVAALGLSILLFVAAGWLLERRLEV